MPSLLIATRNRHKTQEIAQMLGAEFSVKDLLEYPDFPEVEETGCTFLENATLKAVAASALNAHEAPLILADDSGLEVDALGGEPGVYSARFAGKGAGDKANLLLLLEKMRGSALRTARFRCVIVLAQKGEVLASFDGTCEGHLLPAAAGAGGFGMTPSLFLQVTVALLASFRLKSKTRLVTALRP